ncbi:NAD(P)H-dependent flavin oxidoreductase [Romboutsia sp.]|uniref:NAD(P)H-dependent flavin oxidoreductase n=1 Tax=Romboutsia sp. TaxID=1965302 RepID=UPI003F32DBFD
MIKPLIIGDLIAKIPIIQGGMGVGISRSSLASAVAKAGGIGVISSAHVGYDENDFEKDPLGSNLRSLNNHIKKAKENSLGGIIGVNIMVAAKNYDMFVRESIKAGVDIIISGAGLPSKLPSLTKGTSVKIAPIVSSYKAANVILKMWDKKEETTADLIIVEGPKAGGHLGYNLNQLSNIDDLNYDEEFLEIIKIAKLYGDKYNKSIPVIAAGGISNGDDVKKYIDLGASGVQIGTRFVPTFECDAHYNFKMSYINSKKEDIKIVKSPVGLPGRAIRNKFIKDVEKFSPEIKKCYNCLIPCNPKNTPYCISLALINAVKGDIDNGLLFCGSHAYRIDKLSSVDEVLEELTCRL